MDDKPTTEEIERQLLLLQLNKERRPWWKKQETLAVAISIVSAAIAIWSFYDSHSSIDQQAEASRLEMQQLRIDLNMTEQDSVILRRNDQLRKAEVALLVKEKDKAQLADAYVSLKQFAARERIRLYAQIDSLTSSKSSGSDSVQLAIKEQHIKALEQMLDIANRGGPDLSILATQARHEFTSVSGASMREYSAQQSLAAMTSRLLRAEAERCP